MYHTLTLYFIKPQTCLKHTLSKLIRAETINCENPTANNSNLPNTNKCEMRNFRNS